MRIITRNNMEGENKVEKSIQCEERGGGEIGNHFIVWQFAQEFVGTRNKAAKKQVIQKEYDRISHFRTIHPIRLHSPSISAIDYPTTNSTQWNLEFLLILVYETSVDIGYIVIKNVREKIIAYRTHKHTRTHKSNASIG
jgi:hypothetical protein